jgi:hypothetical protein
MLFKLNVKFFLFFSSIILFSKGSEVTLTATTGIINKEINQGLFSFIIKIDVSQNITNTIAKTYFDLDIRKEKNTPYKASTCNVKPVRAAHGQPTETDLMCSFDISDDPNINTETDLFVGITTDNVNPTLSPSSDPPTGITFKLVKFNKISNSITIEEQKLIYTKDDDECVNKHYIFEIVNKENIAAPLQSTVCNLVLSGDDDHKEARCVIPVTGKTMKCSVDVSKKKYIKGSKIIVKRQGLIQCENGQNIEMDDDSENELTINEDCNISKYINFNYLCLLLTLVLL